MAFKKAQKHEDKTLLATWRKLWPKTLGHHQAFRPTKPKPFLIHRFSSYLDHSKVIIIYKKIGEQETPLKKSFARASLVKQKKHPITTREGTASEVHEEKGAER